MTAMNTSTRVSSRLSTAATTLGVLACVLIAGFTVWDKAVSAPPSGRDAPTMPPIDTAGLPTLGSDSAAVVAIEYSDFECPACGVFARDDLDAFKKGYVLSGRVRFVFAFRPLTAIHPSALQAAEAARCAQAQGAFWPMHDRLFHHQDALEESDLKRYAAGLNLDQNQFDQCLADRRTAQEIERWNGAGEVFVDGTPTFVVGRTIAPSLVRADRIVGSPGHGNLRSEIDGALTAVEREQMPR